MYRMLMRLLKGFLSLVAVIALSACGGGGGDDATGQLTVGLTDAAASYQQLFITIKEVRAVPAGDENKDNGAVPLIASFPNGKTLNVLDFQFVQEFLGQATVPAGDYKQVRLILADNSEFDANYITVEDSTGQMVKNLIKTPSAHQSGLKINANFHVGAGESTAILLDFDPNWAVVENGNGSGQYIFKPTGIRVVQTKDLTKYFGGLVGLVSNTDTQAPVAGAVVYAYNTEGELVAATPVISDPELNVGTYRLFLPAAESYQIKVQAPGYEDFTGATPAVIEDQDAAFDAPLTPAAVEKPVAEEPVGETTATP